ncbi:ComEC/Rec2 family competence protein [Saccharomonospora piscinae]|uniref:ComEC/Rec2 family competence protein n=1 Tax=Saccharomonospora piscinae TaxID=687388 RepID=UPI0004679E65|nr:ComEC/Rec2 family competence protein [Saccharomonospora piscinae]
MVIRASAGVGEGTARTHDWRLVPAAMTVWTGALLGLLWGWWACLVAGLLGCGAAVALARTVSRDGRPGTRRWRPAAVILLFCGLLLAWPTADRLAEAERDPLRALARSGAETTLSAVVTERPRALRSAGYAGSPGGARSVLVAADVVSASTNGETVRSRGRVVLIGPSPPWTGVVPGQRVAVRAELAPARPHELTVAVGFVREGIERETPAPWWQQQADSLRTALRAVCGVLAEEEAGLLPGLVVGDTGGLPERVEQEFLDAGMSHLTAVSGSNVAILCGAVLLLARGVRCGPRLAALLAGAALLGFVVLVGSEPSVLRAGVMGAVGLGALVLGRRGSALPALAVAVGALVLYDPAMAVSMGFTLSVVATAGLVLVAPVWSRALGRRGVPAGASQALAVPTVAFLATAPVIAGMVGEVSLVSIVANLVAAPVVAPVTVVGVSAAALAPLWPGAAELLVLVASPGVSWLIVVARQAAAVPGAVLPWPSGWWGGLLAALVVAALGLAVWHRRARLVVALLLVGSLLVLVSVRVVAPAWPPERWALVACDVGQGDGLVLATGEPDRAVVVDTGPDPALLGRCLDRLDITRVPLVVLTHLHADHVGGLTAVFEGRTVGGVAVGSGRTPRWAWREVAGTAAEHGVPLLRLAEGDRFGWDELRVDVLAPPGRTSGAAVDNTDGTEVNNTSVVLRATTAAGRVLLTGDVELAAQARLLTGEADLRADVLKVPHHGSRYTLAAFLTAVSPRIAVTSVGADNTYGHPSPVTLRVLRGLGALTARTDTGGDTAVVNQDGEPAVVRRGPSRRGRVSRRARTARPPPTVARSPWGPPGHRARRGS